MRMRIFCLILLSQLKWFESSSIKSKNNSSDLIGIKPSSVLVCDFTSRGNGTEYASINKPCREDHYSFSFVAYFHNKNLLKPNSLKYIAQALSENTFCEVKYMKYNYETQSLDYFHSGEAFYWYDGKQLNSTVQPEVLIVKDTDAFFSLKNDRKKVIIKCPLPISDVNLSLNGGDPKSFRSAHTHPSINNRVTVSAFHVKLAFSQVQGLHINLKKHRHAESQENFLNFSTISFINKNFLKNNKAPERFLVHYDSKCRSCRVNKDYSQFDPFRTGSILCSLKDQSCEIDGACYANRQLYTPLNYVNDESKIPTLNMFVCNTEYSQTELYMPCAVNNGNCGPGHACLFNATNLEIKCI